MQIEKINLLLLGVIIIGLIYIAFYQPIQQEQKIKKCFDVAIKFEELRHGSSTYDNITNQDILSFQKNILSCITDK